MFWKNLPNRLTWLRILLVPFVMVCLYLGHSAPYETPSLWDFAAAVLFSFAAITDFFDGWFARKYKAESVMGKFLDPLADKLLVVSSLIFLVEKQKLSAWIAIFLVIRDLSIHSFRLTALEENVILPSNNIGKSKTLFLDVAIVALILHGTWQGISFLMIGYYAIALALGASILSALQYLLHYKKIRS